MVSRRQFMQGMGVAGLGLLAGCGRLPGQAQAPKAARLGLLATTGNEAYLDEFEQGLREFGYTIGRDVIIEARYAAGPDGLPALAAELISLPVSIVVTQGISATAAAR